MGRLATHRIKRAHHVRAYADKIRMLNLRRGPTDDIWGATFAIERNGKLRWEPKDGVSTGERDFAEACFKAIELFGLASKGNRVTRDYHAVKHHPLRLAPLANRAVARLRKYAATLPRAEQRTPALKIRNIEKYFAKTTLDDSGNLVETGEFKDAILTELTTDKFAPWAMNLTVIDRKAGGLTNGKRKKASESTLNNADCAFAEIWDQARLIEHLIPESTKRPRIERRHGVAGEVGAFIDLAGVKNVFRLMSDVWVDTPSEYEQPDYRRMFRCYAAILATAGIRTGNELSRTLIANVLLDDNGVHFTVLPEQAKLRPNPNKKRKGPPPSPRTVTAFEKDKLCNLRKLVQEQIDHRLAEGATKYDELFAYPDGTYPYFYDIAERVFEAAGESHEKTSLTYAVPKGTAKKPDKKRTLYSFRHFYATRMIMEGVSLAQLASMMGNSPKEIWKSYQHVFAAYAPERHAQEAATFKGKKIG